MDTAVLLCWPTTYPVCCNLPNMLPDSTKPPKSHWGGQITACDGKGIQKHKSINTLLSIVCACAWEGLQLIYLRDQSLKALYGMTNKGLVLCAEVLAFWRIYSLLISIWVSANDLWEQKPFIHWNNIRRLWRFFLIFVYLTAIIQDIIFAWNVMQQMLCSYRLLAISSFATSVPDTFIMSNIFLFYKDI